MFCRFWNTLKPRIVSPRGSSLVEVRGVSPSARFSIMLPASSGEFLLTCTSLSAFPRPDNTVSGLIVFYCVGQQYDTKEEKRGGKS